MFSVIIGSIVSQIAIKHYTLFAMLAKLAWPFLETIDSTIRSFSITKEQLQNERFPVSDFRNEESYALENMFCICPFTCENVYAEMID